MAMVFVEQPLAAPGSGTVWTVVTEWEIDISYSCDSIQYTVYSGNTIVVPLKTVATVGKIMTVVPVGTIKKVLCGRAIQGIWKLTFNLQLQ